jgi:ParB-like chromosome segregation protein Spo0J
MEIDMDKKTINLAEIVATECMKALVAAAWASPGSRSEISRIEDAREEFERLASALGYLVERITPRSLSKADDKRERVNG